MSIASNVFLHTAALRWAKLEIIHLARFIQQPTCQQQYETNHHWSVRAVYLSLLIVLLLSPFIYFINSLQELLGIEESQPAAATNTAAFFSVVFLAPLLEEALFRSGLRNPICSLLVTPTVAIGLIINSELRVLIFVIFLTIIVILAVIHRDLFFGNLQEELQKLYSRNFKIVFWTNCFYFSCAHLNNFQLSGMQTILFWLIVTPQLFFAVVFSYLRLRDGIKSAILSHATINIIAFAAYSIPS